MATAIHRMSGRFGLISKLKQIPGHLISKEAVIQHVQAKHVHSCSQLLATSKIDMPSLSPTMEKGNIIKWMKQEGETVSPGDVLCEIETDKAVISMDTEEEGVLAKILVPDGTNDVVVGQLIALMVEEGDDWKNVEVPAGSSSSSSSAESSSPAPAAKAAASSQTPAAATEGDGHLMGPSVKKLLQEYNIKSNAVQATGPSGSLLKGDVLKYINSQNLSKVPQTAAPPTAAAAATPAAAPKPAAGAAAAPRATPAGGEGSFVDIPLTNMRRVIAKRLTESKTTIPHAYAAIDSDMGEVTSLRLRLKAEGVKVSVNDFIIKASSLALQKVPQVNAIWANGAQRSNSVDISVAVATPNGLITPIVKSANFLSVDQISETVKELAGRAKIGKLQPHEYQGGTFSISNLGMFGISEFTAVINPPQLAILAVGTSRSVARPDGMAGLEMTVSLSYDSRALDPLDATRFLEEFRAALEDPQCMLAGTRLDAKAEAFGF